MHAIITCIALNFADAGRQPLTAIHNLADDYSKAIKITVTDDVAGCLCVQVINPAEDSPLATSPVPVSNLKRVRTINKLEGLAMLERRNAHLAQEESESAVSRSMTGVSSLKRVRTVNKLEGLAMLERRKALLAEQESSGNVPAQASSLKRVRTINRLDGLAKLERRKAHLAGEDFTIPHPLTGAVHASTLKRVRTIIKSAGLALLARRSAEDSGADSLVLSESDVSTLGGVRTINKLAGLNILQRRKARAEAQASSWGWLGQGARRICFLLFLFRGLADVFCSCSDSFHNFGQDDTRLDFNDVPTVIRECVLIIIHLILTSIKRHGRSLGGCTRCQVQGRNGEAAGGGRVTLAKSAPKPSCPMKPPGRTLSTKWMVVGCLPHSAIR